jgi:subtilisin-like proprotein convertase family protein
MRYISLLVVFLVSVARIELAAQQTPPEVRSKPDFVSTPVKPVLTIPADQAERAPKPSGPAKATNPRRTYPRPGGELVPQGPPKPELDPLLAIQERMRAATRALIPSLNFAAQGYSNVNPSDPVGAIGNTHYVQMINGLDGTRVTIYNKTTGAVVSGPFLLETLGAGGDCAQGHGDPIALYDRLAQRWMLSEFAATGSHLCVYVSETSSATGAYYRYDFPTPSFPDYPKYSVWPNAYYVTTNESSPTIYALDRTSMLSGAAATMQRFTVPDLAGFGFQALTPGDFEGPIPPPPNAPGYFARHRDDEVHNSGSADSTKDFVEIWQVLPNFATPANSVLSGPTNIGVASFDSSLCGLTSFNCFPQPGSAVTLDPLREVVMWRMQYRNFGSHASLLGNFVVDVNGADRGGIRWFELRKIGNAAWTLYQEGTYSPDATNRWMGSMAMDGAGNIAMGYSVSSTSVFPGLRSTGRHAADALGTMTVAEATIVNGAAPSASNRWGDYHAMTLDPVDDCTFWFTGQYAPASTWGTRIATMKFDDCGTPPPALSINNRSLAEGDSGTTNATFTVTLSEASAGPVDVDYATANVTAVATGGSSTTFSNPESISIPTFGAATPYPSDLTVPAMGTVQKVTVTLNDFIHTYPEDVDILLVGPAGQKVMLMSDVGGGANAGPLTLTFDDAASPLGSSTLSAGTYKPTDLQPGETLPASAPAGPYGTLLSVFNGVNPAGIWKLYAADDFGGDLGSLTGWSLTFAVPGVAGDYTPVSGTLTFTAGQVSKPLAVPIHGDVTFEANETFHLNLSNALGAVINDSQGVGTILNDDGVPFTDDPLVAGSTLVRAIHVTELRSRIDAIRIAKGLGVFAWGPALTAGSSTVLAQHVLAMRTALTQAYAAVPLPAPAFTDPSLAAGTTIKAIHITDLRNAVVAIE